MKRKVIFSMMILSSSLFALSGCENHTHTFDMTKWVSNSEQHWHSATCGHAVFDSVGNHADSDGDSKCDTCGYVMETPVHVHTFSDKWDSNSNEHWHVATCGHDVQGDLGAHIDNDGDYCCDVCNYNMGSRPDPEPETMFTVRFLNNDLSVLESVEVPQGGHTQYGGEKPEYAGTEAEKLFYCFSDWDKEAINVQSNLDITAIYTKVLNKDYHKFVNYDDSFLYDVTVNEGESVSYIGDTPTKTDFEGEQFSFLNWLDTEIGEHEFSHKAQFNSCSSGLVIDDDGKIVGYGGDSANVVIPDVWNGNPVTEIDSDTFRDNTTVESITIGENVNIIEDYAFEGCTNLTTINFPEEDPLIIGDHVFDGCTSLTEIEIPENTIEIGEYAFTNSGLQTITLPESIDEIEIGTFEGCSDLVTVVLPEQLTVIKSHAFYSCTSLLNISLEHVKVIEENAFFNIGMEEMFVPSTVERMGEDVFSAYYEILILTDAEECLTGWDPLFCGGGNVVYGYTGNRGVATDSNGFYYTYIEEEKFGDTFVALIDIDDSKSPTGTVEYYVPSNVTDINTSTEYEVDEYLVFGNITDEDDNLVIRPSLQNVKSIEFSNSIKTIGARSFCNFSLESISLPEYLHCINFEAFSCVVALNDIVIQFPNFLERVEMNAFNSTSAFGSFIFYIPTNLEYLGMFSLHGAKAIYVERGSCGPHWNSNFNFNAEDRTIYGCTGGFKINAKNLKYTETPSGEKILITYSDKNIASFTSGLVITHNITAIGPGVFANFKNLKTVNISSRITKVYNDAFLNCDLYSLTIGNLELAGKSLFDSKDLVYTKDGGINYFGYSENPYLVAVSTESEQSHYEIHNDCKILYSNIFYTNESIIDVELPSGLLDIGKGAFASSTLESIVIPSTVKHIGSSAFSYCNKLESVSLNSCNITQINRNTFMSTDITSITLPDTVKFIDQQAFYGCANMKTFISGTDLTLIGSDAFSGCSALETVSLSDSCEALFNNAFNGCIKLSQIDLKNVSILGYSCFGQSGLTSLTLPDTLIKVEGSCLSNCKNLETVTLGNGLTSLAHMMFYGDSKLKTIVLPSSLDEIMYNCFNNSGLETIYIPENITYIGTEAFKDCENLTSIDVAFESRPNTWAKHWAGNCNPEIIHWGA